MTLSRKLLLFVSLIALSVSVLASTSEKAGAGSAEVIKQLKDGNARFVSGKQLFPNQDAAALKRTSTAQHPKAIVLSCSDSRVPVEKVFDMGIGDLFVIRTAGGVCGVDETGTIEYGIEHLGASVVLVMGHSNCEAVTAVTTDAELGGSILPLVDNIRPAVKRAHDNNPSKTAKDLVSAAVTENVWQSLEDLFRRSSLVRDKVASGDLKVIGGVYNLQDGTVSWLGAHPRQSSLLVSLGGRPKDNDAEFYATMERKWPDVSEVEAPDGVRASDVLGWLKKGNNRFSANQQLYPNIDRNHIAELAIAQHPLATVLTCSDSRVPPEELFDCGAGDLFVVRVAGNVADVDETGSVEYGCGHLGTPLLVILGHTSCGAVTAVATASELPGSISELLDNIKPAVEKAAQGHPDLKGKDLVPAAVKANVWQTIEDLFNNSPEICALAKAGKLQVVGAVYNLDNGSIDWLGQHPDESRFIQAQYTMCKTGGHPTVVRAQAVTVSHDEPVLVEATQQPAAVSEPEKPSKLDEAIKKLETTVNTVASTPAADPAQAKPAPVVAENKVQSSSVNDEIARLQAQVTKLTEALKSQQVSESTLVSLAADIEYLKAENAQLKGETEQTSRMLASLDNDITAPAAVNPAQADKLAALVSTLNESIEKQKASTKPSVNAPSIKHGSINLTGFVHEQYYSKAGKQSTSTFDTKRARLGVAGDINQYAKIELVGDFAKTPKLVDGYLALSPNKNWNIRVGQHKIPFSTDVMRSSTSLPFVNLSLASILGPDRDIGFTTRFATKLVEGYTLDLYAGVVNGAGINVSDANKDKNYVFRAETKLANTITVAPNWYGGKTNDTGTARQNFNTYGSSLTWSWKREIVEAEYIGSKVGSIRKEGWYAYAGHTVTLKSAFLPEVQFLVRYEQWDPSLKVAGDKVNRLSLGTNLFIDKKYTEIQLNYQFNGEQGTQVKNDELMLNFQVAF